MKEYRVTLYEEVDSEFAIVFDCTAEDPDHAEEQAINAYPDGEVVDITEKED